MSTQNKVLKFPLRFFTAVLISNFRKSFFHCFSPLFQVFHKICYWLLGGKVKFVIIGARAARHPYRVHENQVKVFWQFFHNWEKKNTSSAIPVQDHKCFFFRDWPKNPFFEVIEFLKNYQSSDINRLVIKVFYRDVKVNKPISLKARNW